MRKFSACLFDLDGVIVDTAKYHYVAWRQIALELGFEFSESDNERLKGVSRQRSMEILLEVGAKHLPDDEKARLAEKKNALYLTYVMKMSPDEILPGAQAFLESCRNAGYKTALASASKNAAVILDLLKITSLFDVVMDGTKVSRTKPDPEVFLNCADALALPPQACVVFEDAEAGIDAARTAGMYTVGIGNPSILHKAQLVVPGLHALSLEALESAWGRNKNDTVA